MKSKSWEPGWEERRGEIGCHGHINGICQSIAGEDWIQFEIVTSPFCQWKDYCSNNSSYSSYLETVNPCKGPFYG